MVVQQFIKLENPLQVANLERFLVTHSQPIYIHNNMSGFGNIDYV